MASTVVSALREAESSNPWLNAKRCVQSAPRAIWSVFFIAFFGAFGTSGGNAVLIPYLSDEFGYTDVGASTLAGCMALTLVVISFLNGFVIERLGLRTSMIFGGVSGVAGVLTLVFAWETVMLVIAVVLLLPISMSFVSTCVFVAMKRYSFEYNRGTICVLAYMATNIGAALSLEMVDAVRSRFAHPTTLSGYITYQVTSSRIIFLVGAIATLMVAVIAGVGITDVIVDAKGEVRPYTSKLRTIKWLPLVRSLDFKCLLWYSFCMMFSMKDFTFWDRTFPKIAVRELGVGVQFGAIKSINAWMITLLLVPWSHLTRRVSIYSKMIVGTFCASLSIMILCAPASYATYISSIVLFTLLGEMVFSPFTSEFSMHFVPEGLEAIYSSLTGIYLMVPNFLQDILGGWLLSVYCPLEGERHCSMVPLFFGLFGLASTVLLILSRNWLDPRKNASIGSAGRVSFADGDEGDELDSVGRFEIVDRRPTNNDDDNDDFGAPAIEHAKRPDDAKQQRV